MTPNLVPKLSLATGLIYTYTKPANAAGVDGWYLAAIEFRTSRTGFSHLAGTGFWFNSNYAPDYLFRGRAYVGVLGGIVELHDSEGFKPVKPQGGGHYQAVVS